MIPFRCASGAVKPAIEDLDDPRPPEGPRRAAVGVELVAYPTTAKLPCGHGARPACGASRISWLLPNSLHSSDRRIPGFPGASHRRRFRKMIDILSPAGLGVLAEASRLRLIVAFDFDGTLAPIVDEPDDARMRDNTRRLLRVLSVLSPCAVISGRERADVKARLGSPALALVVGNYGSEDSEAPPPAAVRARARAWADALRQATDPEEVQVEDKGFTVALHCRQSRTWERTSRRLWALARMLPGAKVVGGRGVVNLLPREAPTKGDAVTDFAGRYPGRPVAFIGDDEGDEDAFQAPAVTLPIRVGQSLSSKAVYFLRSQESIDRLFQDLIAARIRADGFGEGILGIPASGRRRVR